MPLPRLRLKAHINKALDVVVDASRRGLDRRGGRSLLGLLVAARWWVNNRLWVPVTYESEGYWLLHYPEAVVPSAAPRLVQRPAETSELTARDAFFHHYEPVAGDIVLDIGAGVGEEVNLLSRLVGDTGHVFAIEAHPTTYQWMQRRIAANDLHNVTPLNLAITDTGGSVSIADDDNYLENGLTTSTGLTVTAQTIPGLFEQLNLTQVDFLKMNIEGAEKEALEGMGPVATKVRHAAVSCHDFRADRGDGDWARTKTTVLATLREQGFEVQERDAYPATDYWLRDYVYAHRTSDGIASST